MTVWGYFVKVCTGGLIQKSKNIAWGYEWRPLDVGTCCLCCECGKSSRFIHNESPIEFPILFIFIRAFQRMSLAVRVAPENCFYANWDPLPFDDNSPSRTRTTITTMKIIWRPSPSLMRKVYLICEQIGITLNLAVSFFLLVKMITSLLEITANSSSGKIDYKLDCFDA